MQVTAMTETTKFYDLIYIFLSMKYQIGCPNAPMSENTEFHHVMTIQMLEQSVS